jgi:AraC family transcriptional regulator
MRSVQVSSAQKLRIEACAPLTCVVCEAGSQVDFAFGTVAVVVPVLGSAEIATSETHVEIHRGDIYVSDHQREAAWSTGERGLCVAFAGDITAWSGASRHSERGLFPAVHRRNEVSNALLKLAHDHNLHRGTPADEALMQIVAGLQASFDELVARCPGTHDSRRLAVFARLQRVRNYIIANAHRDLEVPKLARMANYSPTHFITTFRTVFQETPYTLISRLRLRSAEHLLLDRSLAVNDVAHATGYQSRSSFSRAVRRHLGKSPSGVRAGSIGEVPDVFNR